VRSHVESLSLEQLENLGEALLDFQGMSDLDAYIFFARIKTLLVDFSLAISTFFNLKMPSLSIFYLDIS
jgi:hypothetical protein